jgi:hypothetical protein
MAMNPLESKTYRVQLTAGEHKAYKVWCAQNEVKASEHLSRFIRKTIKKDVGPVAEMHESENT